MQKIELPIEKDDIKPTNPDFSWWFKMIGIFFGVLIFSYIAFWWFSKMILANIDLETEKKWFWDLAKWQHFNYQDYIDYKIPEFQNYNFYISNSTEVNAYAFIWWNINITEGLLENIENQEELIFIMAHEVWHINNRDNLKAFTTTIPLQLTFALLWFDISIWDSSIIDISNNVLSKQTEINADKEALKLFEKYKINPLCTIYFFKRNHNSGDTIMELLSDHPLNLSRIKILEQKAKEMGFKNKKNCKKIDYIVK